MKKENIRHELQIARRKNMTKPHKNVKLYTRKNRLNYKNDTPNN
jgi:hypothetical protein